METDAHGEWLVGLLNATEDPVERQLVVNGLRRAAVAVKGPDLLRSGIAWELEPETRAARCPLTQIQGLPRRLIDRLLAARATRPFATSCDVVARCGPSEREIALLVRSGAFDSLAAGWTRPEHLWLLVDLRRRGSAPLFELRPPRSLSDYGSASKLLDEHRTLGLLLSRHPVDLLAAKVAQVAAAAGIERLADSEAVREGLSGTVALAAMVASCSLARDFGSRQGPTRRLLLEDRQGYCRATVAGGAARGAMRRGECYLFSGKAGGSSAGGLLAVERAALLDRSFSGVYVFCGS